jgi:hypothetical protein
LGFESQQKNEPGFTGYFGVGRSPSGRRKREKVTLHQGKVSCQAQPTNRVRPADFEEFFGSATRGVAGKTIKEQITPDFTIQILMRELYFLHVK